MDHWCGDWIGLAYSCAGLAELVVLLFGVVMVQILAYTSEEDAQMSMNIVGEKRERREEEWVEDIWQIGVQPGI